MRIVKESRVQPPAAAAAAPCGASIQTTDACSATAPRIRTSGTRISLLLAGFLLISLASNVSAAAFQPRRPSVSSYLRSSPLQTQSSSQQTHTTLIPPKQSTTGTNNQDSSCPPPPQQPQQQHWAQPLLAWALQSPLWQHVLVPAARQKIVTTARANGILWSECRDWLYSQTGPWQHDDDNHRITGSNIPNWYRQAPYHAYETGHLNWDAALEMELASAAVGARNMPQAGLRGEAVFRHQFRNALASAGAAVVPPLNNNHSGGGARILDIGCATGTSTRWLAREWLGSPTTQDHRLVGLDLSPYLIAVATRLAELAPLRERSVEEDGTSSGEWICDIPIDPRISFLQGNGACTPFANNTFDVINLQFVAHELPVAVTLDIVREAHRLLKPGTGQLWFCEMDFQSPAYAAQRQNPFLFALIRATEPYLDEYAEGQPQIWQCLQETFASTVIVPATGRHFAVVATKGGSSKTASTSASSSVGTLTDLRFDEAGNYKVQDTHLQVWENKATASADSRA